jgi:hypothetical protein
LSVLRHTHMPASRCTKQQSSPSDPQATSLVSTCALYGRRSLSVGRKVRHGLRILCWLLYHTLLCVVQLRSRLAASWVESTKCHLPQAMAIDACAGSLLRPRSRLALVACPARISASMQNTKHADHRPNHHCRQLQFEMQAPGACRC